MNIRLAAALLAFGLAAAPAVPVSAAVTLRDAQGVAHLNLDTQLIPQRGSGYYGGTLKLTITPDGIVSGFFRPDDGMVFHTVTGGLNGDRIWLDIGYNGDLHITGTLNGDRIVGGTYIGDHLFDFKAAPEKS
jgi:hypothetical protein